MKKNSLLFSIALILALSGCNWTIPQKVNVKADAEYNFSVGTIFEKNLDDIINKDKIFSSIATDGKIQVYDYLPNGSNVSSKGMEKQQFLLKVPIQDIPLNFADAFDKTSIASGLQDFSFEQEIEIPDFSIYEQIEIGEVLGGVENLITNLIKTGGSNSSLNFGLTGFEEIGSFDEIEYSNAFVKITDLSNLVPNNTNVTIKSKNGEILGSGSFNNHIAQFYLSSVVFSSSGMKIECDYPLTYSFELVRGDLINAKNISLNQKLPTIPINRQVNVTNTSETTKFNSCIIGDGNLSLGFLQPESWENVGIEYSIVMTEGLNIPTQKSQNGICNINLDNVEILPKNTDVVVGLNLSFKNSTIYFNDKPKIELAGEINQLKEIQFDFRGDDLIETRFQKSEPVASEIKEKIDNVVINRCGLVVNYTNTLPENNDIELDVSSEILGLQNKSGFLFSNTNNSSCSIVNENQHTINLQTAQDWDFDVSLILPGATRTEPNLLKIYGVETNKKYRFGISIEPVIEMKSVTVKTADFSQSGSQDLGFKINDLLSFLSSDEEKFGDILKNVEIESLPLYLYATMPSGDNFDGVGVTGKIDIVMKNQKGEIKNKFSLLTEEENMNIIEPFKLEPVLGTNLITTDLDTKQYSFKKDVKELINNTKDSTEDTLMFVEYNVTFRDPASTSKEPTITIDMEDLEIENSNMSIYAMIVMPVTFKVDTEDSQSFALDLLDFIQYDNSKDLFNRVNPTDITKIKDLLKDIYLGLTLDVDTSIPLIINNDDVKISAKISGLDKTEIKISGGKIQANDEQIIKMLESEKINLESLELIIPDETIISVPTKLNFDLGFSASVAVKGNIEVPLNKNK